MNSQTSTKTDHMIEKLLNYLTSFLTFILDIRSNGR